MHSGRQEEKSKLISQKVDRVLASCCVENSSVTKGHCLSPGHGCMDSIYISAGWSYTKLSHQFTSWNHDTCLASNVNSLLWNLVLHFWTWFSQTSYCLFGAEPASHQSCSCQSIAAIGPQVLRPWISTLAVLPGSLSCWESNRLTSKLGQDIKG